MAKYRLAALANLARQLSFTPHDTRALQINAAEVLLHDLQPQKAYPLDFVVFRITGYQPKTDGNSDLLTGIALQHDLGLLIEQVSDGLKLSASQSTEPVLSIDDVTERFDVTSKTIQRWRRRGLPARRFTFGDGKRRVGFFLSSVERFIAGHRDQLGSTTLCTALDCDEQNAIVRHARRLAVDCGCSSSEICVRIGRKFHRTPMTVLHTLRKHDAEHPTRAVLPLAAVELTDEQAARIVRGRKRGLGIKALARKIHRPRATVYRAIVQDRVVRINKRKIRFIDDPLYHDADAAQAIADIVSQQELGVEALAGEARMPRDLPVYLRDLYRTPLLSPARERALFLKFNFHKFQFVGARRKLEPEFATARELNLLEQHLRQATAVKNQILQANLRLVVSVARRHVRGNLSLMELISEGNMTLMRAVEGFDIHKGYRFSTYATLALMKGFAQAVPMMVSAHRGGADVEMLSSLPDRRSLIAVDQRIDRDHVQHLLNRLDDRERAVLLAYYGLAGEARNPAVPATYEEVGQQLGISKQRVRQIEQSALEKLRRPGE
jgi:RNA polymerase sigma factor (sigma-70 family)